MLELLPDFAGTRSGRKTVRKVQDLVNPDRDLKDAAYEYEQAKTAENARRLAEELLIKEQFAEASYCYAKLLQQCGDTQKALAVYEKILATAKVSGSYYNEIHGKWIKLTNLELRR